jgi:hypothetical protein
MTIAEKGYREEEKEGTAGVNKHLLTALNFMFSVGSVVYF